MVTRLDNMNLPPDLRDVGVDEILQTYIHRLQDNMVHSQRTPVGGDINDFFPLVHKAIISRQRTEGIDDEKMVLFVEEDPPEKLDTEAITFYIQARSPGQFNQGPAGSVGHKEVRHHVRGIIEHPEHPSELLISAGKFYDNYIKFNVYAKTNKQARARMIWFTQVMDQYNWYFKMTGFVVIEQGVGDRQRIQIPDYGWVTRYPITYYIRSEDIQHYGTQELKHVVLDIDVDFDD